MIKTAVIDHDIWAYCDPDKTNVIVQPDDLPNQMKVTQERLYMFKVKDYERKRKSLAVVNSLLQGSVTDNFRHILKVHIAYGNGL